MRVDFREVRFSVSSTDMTPRLQELISWLEGEAKRVAIALSKLEQEPPAKTAAGVPLRTDASVKRSSLEHEAACIMDDHELARVWLAECGVQQSWLIGIELARWINRPILALSALRR